MTEIEFIPLSGGAHLGANAFLLRVQFPGTGKVEFEADFETDLEAAGGESGSETGGRRVEILLDAGAISHEAAAWIEALDRPDLVWISHVHWDHLGALPHLAERFRRLSVVGSAPTVELAGLAMSLASGARRKAAARSEAIAQGMRALKFRQFYELDALAGHPAMVETAGSGVRVMMFEAGHLLGAAMLLVEIDRENEQPFRILYSGDFCTHDQAWLPGAAIPRPSADFQIDAFISEGVLATNSESDQVDYDAELKRMVGDCLGVDGPRLIAVSALGESSEIIAALCQALEEQSENSHVLIVHEYFRPILEVFSRYNPVLKRVRYADQRVCAQMLKTGALVVAGGDQLQNGTVAGELALEILSDAAAQILVFNGVYSQTPAGKLLAGEPGKRVKLGGRLWDVHARIERYQLPLHAPRWQLIETARAVNASKIVLVHGHERQLYSLRRAMLATLGDVEVVIPKNGEVITLLPTS